METKSKKAKSSFLNLGSNMGKSKLLQGVVTLAGIVLYLLARKSKNKIRHTFLLILVCTMGVASFSRGNKSQKKVDLNKALDNVTTPCNNLLFPMLLPKLRKELFAFLLFVSIRF